MDDSDESDFSSAEDGPNESEDSNDRFDGFEELSLDLNSSSLIDDVVESVLPAPPLSLYLSSSSNSNAFL